MSAPLVVLTRAHTHALTRNLRDRLGPAYRVAGAAVTRTEIAPNRHEAAAAATSGAHTWVCVTSPTAAHVLLEGDPPPNPATALAAVGRATARALADHGWLADLVGPGSAAGLVELFPSPPANGRVLLPCSRQASPTLARGLADAGWDVDRVDLYDTVALDRLPEVYRDAWAVCATAGSRVRALATLGLWDHGGGPALVTMGASSLAVARDLGLEAVAAPTPDAAGLAGALATLPHPASTPSRPKEPSHEQ